jgi:hypothetical protein
MLNPNHDHTEEWTAVGDPSDSTAKVSFESPVEFWIFAVATQTQIWSL